MAPRAQTPKLRMVCSYCGSERVLRDAYAAWDVRRQKWVLQNVFDAAVCESKKCDGGETRIDEVTVRKSKKAQSTTPKRVNRH